MGMLRSKTYAESLVINGVTLGQPIVAKADGTQPQPGDTFLDLWFIWDDSALPNGVINSEGIVVPDEL